MSIVDEDLTRVNVNITTQEDTRLASIESLRKDKFTFVVFSVTSYRACVHAQPINISSYHTAIPSPSRLMLHGV